MLCWLRSGRWSRATKTRTSMPSRRIGCCIFPLLSFVYHIGASTAHSVVEGRKYMTCTLFTLVACRTKLTSTFFHDSIFEFMCILSVSCRQNNGGKKWSPTCTSWATISSFCGTLESLQTRIPSRLCFPTSKIQ